MKSFFRIAVLLLVAASLQTCDDLAYESAESQVNRAKAEQRIFREAKHAFTFTAIVTSENGNQFMANIQLSGGSILVNWGDGTSDTYTLGDYIELVKIYAAPGQYQVSFTGDIKNITQFQSSYGQGLMSHTNFRPLTGLESLRMSYMGGPEVIDVSGAKNLNDFTPFGITNLREIYLPKQHSLWAVSIAGDTILTATTVNTMINSVYQTAVKKNILGGFFHLLKYPYDEEGRTDMVGPPSAQSIQQLTELQNVYGWEIMPEMPR